MHTYMRCVCRTWQDGFSNRVIKFRVLRSNASAQASGVFFIKCKVLPPYLVFVALIHLQTSEMKKQDTEESAPQDSESATPSTTEMQSSAAVKDSESPEASEPQISQTDAQSQSDEAVSEGKSPNF